VGVAVVTRDYTIEAINAARRMLSIPGLGVGQDFLHAMQEVPYAEVRQTIDEAFREGRTTQADEFAVEEVATGEPSYLRLTCHPRRTEAEGQEVGSVLVAVEDVTAAVRLRRLTEKNLRLEEANRELVHLQRGLCVMGYSVPYETSNFCSGTVGKEARTARSRAAIQRRFRDAPLPDPSG